MLKAANVELDRAQTQFKLVHCLSNTTNYNETVAQSEIYLKVYTNGLEMPQVRFFLATAFKKLGHNNDSMKQVLLLLQAEQEDVKTSPETWAYWQQRGEQ